MNLLSNKVKNIYLYTDRDYIIGISQFATGLVFELEDGRLFAQTTTDMLEPFTEITGKEPTYKEDIEE